MRVLTLLVRGFKTANKKSRMVLYLWLINFSFSLMMVTPFYFLVNKEFSRSLMGEKLVKGIDISLLGDIIFKHKDISQLLLGWILIPGLLFLLLFIFLNGGIIGRIVATEERVNLKSFLSDCSTYFLRFLKVFLISLIGYALAFGLIFTTISSLLKLLTKNASTEWPLIIVANLKFIMFILIFSVVRMLFDYVKIWLVTEKSRKVLKVVIHSFSFIGQRFLKAWLLYLLVMFVGLVFGLAYLGISQSLPSIVTLTVILFLVQQAYILTRMWVKILFFSTEYHFFAQEKNLLQ